MKVENLAHTCRTCLSELQRAPSKFYHLHHKIECELSIEELLKTIFNLKALDNNNSVLPQNICSDCFEWLLKYREFYKKCLQSEKRLTDLIMNDQNKSPISSDDAIKSETGPMTTQPSPQSLLPDLQKIEFVNGNTENFEVIAIKNDVSNMLKKFSKETTDNATDDPDKELLENGQDEAVLCYICSTCNECFFTLISLEAHMNLHVTSNEAQSQPTDQLDSSSKDTSALQPKKKSRKTKRKTVDNLTDRVCDVCDKQFSSRAGLANHKKRHEEKLFKCSQCDHKTYTKASLEIHKRKHTGEKPYKCGQCDKRFSQQGSLSLHTLTHTGLRPHKCHLCSSAFKQSHHLQYHLQSHSGEKPFICISCAKGFASKRNLEVHSRSHTGLKSHFCTLCDKGFYDQHGLSKHVKRCKAKATPAQMAADGQTVTVLERIDKENVGLLANVEVENIDEQEIYLENDGTIISMKEIGSPKCY